MTAKARHPVIALDELIADVRRQLAELGGFDAPSLRAVRRDLSKQVAGMPPEAVIKLAQRLLESPLTGHRFLAYETILFHRPALSSLRITDLEQLGRGIDSWGAVDMFACFISGPAWRERQIPDAAIHRWARSRDRWWRRAALVSTVPLNNKTRGGRCDSERTLEVCRMLVDDSDDMVVKAMSWALRELAKRDPVVVRSFLNTFEDRLAPRVLREVGNKLSTGLKNPGRAKRK